MNIRDTHHSYLERGDGYRALFYVYLQQKFNELVKLEAELDDRREAGFAHVEDMAYPVVPDPHGYVPPNSPGEQERLYLMGRRLRFGIDLKDVFGRENVWSGPPVVKEASNGLSPEELRAFYVRGWPTADQALEAPLEIDQPLAINV